MPANVIATCPLGHHWQSKQTIENKGKVYRQGYRKPKTRIDIIITDEKCPQCHQKWSTIRPTQ